jgi:hypothetical protein
LRIIDVPFSTVRIETDSDLSPVTSDIKKFLRKESVHANQILRKRETHFGENPDTLQTVRFSIAEFHRGRQDCHDEHPSGRSQSPHLSPRSISPPLNISHGGVLRLTDDRREMREPEGRKKVSVPPHRFPHPLNRRK